MNLASRVAALQATLATAKADRVRIAYAVEFEGASPTLLYDAIIAGRAAEARLESFGIAAGADALMTSLSVSS